VGRHHLLEFGQDGLIAGAGALEDLLETSLLLCRELLDLEGGGHGRLLWGAAFAPRAALVLMVTGEVEGRTGQHAGGSIEGISRVVEGSPTLAELLLGGPASPLRLPMQFIYLGR
jgi:hypothetical protein